MSNPLQSMRLWADSLGCVVSEFKDQRELLKVSLDEFRIRAAHLVASIRSELPTLTVHDITHLDALWRVAGEIAGPEIKLNPAEAFVFGGAVLLHDAAHVMAAYDGGLNQIKNTLHWQDFVAQRFSGKEPEKNSQDEKLAIFQVLRHLHAEQAHELARMKWTVPGSGDDIYLIQSVELRNYYGDLIGEIASSHHWSPDRVAENFKDRVVPCPAFLQPADWKVDALKIAFLLRVADAAHLDDLRAPWFLFALQRPQGISELHWRFQAKMGQPTRTENGELIISSGAPFSQQERQSWWLAFDTARMIDKELRSAYVLMKENGRCPFAAQNVLNIDSPESFARQVRVDGWEPVNVGPSVGDIPRLISVLGGAALYGNDHKIPLRELLQNSMDAVRALRKLHELSDEAGQITVSITINESDELWLNVLDNGIGMSRYVLTSVLLDFGNSLWKSDALREEVPGLAKTGFEAGGKFGIGFFSVFMLGDDVKITSRRFERAKGDAEDQWQLVFEQGLSGRPLLSKPKGTDRLNHSGTRVSVKIGKETIEMLSSWGNPAAEKDLDPLEVMATRLNRLVSYLCPASDVQISTKYASTGIQSSVKPYDWKNMGAVELLERVRCQSVALFPLMSVSGEMLGRVGVLSSFYKEESAAITVKGIRGGEITGLAGVVLAGGNNSDAQRASANMVSTLPEWQAWAKLAATSGKLHSYAALQVHPLIPEHDFSIWTICEDDFLLSEVVEYLSTVDEVLVHCDSISHDDDDDLSSSRFENSFQPVDNIICYPNHGPRKYFWPEHRRLESLKSFPWALGVDPIDYQSVLEKAIAEAWGEFIKRDIDTTIGEADNVDINRGVTLYKRL